MTEPTSIKRSRTLEKLTALLQEKKQKLAEAEEKRKAIQDEALQHDAEFKQFMNTVITPRQRDTPRESLGSSASIELPSDNRTVEEILPTKPTHAPIEPKPPAEPSPSAAPNVVRFAAAVPELARGISRHAASLSRSASRNATALTRSASRQAVALTRSVSRTAVEGLNQVSKLGATSARLTRNLARALQEDRNKMLANSVLREAAHKAQNPCSKTPSDDPMNLLSISTGTGLGAEKFKENLAREKAQKQHLASQIEKRLQGKRPWFARIVTLFQGILVVVMMVTGDLAPWGISVSNSAVVVPLFVGSEVQAIATPQNPYYGPDAQTLVLWGSKWSPCMRQHATVLQVQAEIQQLSQESGCCLNMDMECGAMVNTTCDSFGGTFFPTQRCADVSACRAITLRPCCYGIMGQCVELTERHCQVIQGKWHTSKERCGQVDCLNEQCGMTDVFATSQPNQFYRFFVAMFLHVGVIHYVMNALSQYLLVAQVEFVAGWFRTAIMYVMSGAFGFLISALFSADSLSNGSSAAIYGMLGVETVDLFQTWQLLERRKSQVIGLVVKLVLFLGIGTLPYIDNFAHIGGFIAGVVAAICFMPYISFSRFDAARKLLLKLVSMVLLFVLAGGLLYKFYTSHEISCSWCQYLDCVPYKQSMCSNHGR